jgi:hypothetical protein
MDFDEEEEGFSSNPNDFPPSVLTSTGSFQGVSGNSPLITAGQVVNDNTLAQQYLNQPGVRKKYDEFVNAERDLRLAAPSASQTPVDLRTAAFGQRVLGKQSRAAYPYVAATLPQASYGAAATTSIYPPINNMSNIQGTQFYGLGNVSAFQGSITGDSESMNHDSDSDPDLDIKTLTEAYGDKMPEGGKGKRRRKRQSTKKKKRRSTKKRKSKKRKQSTNKKK